MLESTSPPVIHVYGPVPSRRLGFSLGIDILPYKTCSLDCIYCQLGRSVKKTIKRKAYFSQEKILAQIKEAIKSEQQIDYITFSGSGEPTLNTILGPLIKDIKKITDIPVAVLTNGTLLYQKSVRQALLKADLVVPSLDALTQTTFIKVNRPHPKLLSDRMINGLKTFRREFKGEIWLEVMLLKNINDSPDFIRKLKSAIASIRPEKVQLNTVVRPPAEEYALPLSLEELERIRADLGTNAEIIAEFNKKQLPSEAVALEQSVYALIRRRPVTLLDLADALGKHQNELLKYLDILQKKEKITTVVHAGKKYYEPA